jgi:hypothetical protein
LTSKSVHSVTRASCPGTVGAGHLWDPVRDEPAGPLLRIEVGSPIFAVAVTGGDTIVLGGPSGLIAIEVRRDVVLTDRPRRGLGIRAVPKAPEPE